MHLGDTGNSPELYEEYDMAIDGYIYVAYGTAIDLIIPGTVDKEEMMLEAILLPCTSFDLNLM